MIATRFYETDERYSDFLAQDATASVLAARVGQRIFAMSYNAYQELVYDGSSAEAQTVAKAYQLHRQAVKELMAKLPTLLPAEADTFAAFAKRFDGIVALMDAAIIEGARNNDEQAKVLLSQADPQIASFTTDMRTWNDNHISAVMAQSNAISDATWFTIMATLGSLFAVFLLGLVVSILVSKFGISAPVQALRARMIRLAEGDVESPIPGMDRKDELGAMAGAVATFRDAALAKRRLEQDTESGRQRAEQERAQGEALKAREAEEIRFAVEGLASGLAALSTGELHYRLDQQFAGELDRLRQDFNRAMTTLRETMDGVASSTRGIGAGAQEIRSAANDLSKRTEQQAASVEETAAALEQITTTVRDAALRAEEAGKLVSRARNGAQRSGEVMGQAVAAMVQIEKSSTEISNIIGVIDEIAFQTNLLALNAGVEAARAGEAGKGFAVVAQEVRELAQRSAQAAKEIKALISTSGAQVQSGVNLVGRTGDSLQQIVSDVEQIDQNVRAIVESAREQATGLQEINTAVNEIDQNTQQNAAMVEQTTAASHSLMQEIDALGALLSQFKTDGMSGTMAAPGQRRPAPMMRAAG
ncbi:methyl-accepting chemotaxis protein [Xaviernesmea oryzae]|nr:HAMP domain-containing methyl-accepting chemotaxis protein [Xaviernesmea oryzae]